MDSLICWVGGKRILRKKLAERFPKNFNGYIEVFGGAGWLLFLKERWANLEVYNDIDSRLTNLFMVAKYHPEALEKELELMIDSRELFGDLLTREGITDIQKAARFFYLIKRSFGAQGEHYGTSKKDNSTKSLTRMVDQIMQVAKRLDKVKIENRDYKEIFALYDSEDNFFFLDPPYRFGHQYKTGRMDYEEFLSQIRSLKGKFLLTIDDCPENLEMFKEFNIERVERANGINKKVIKNKMYKELIITNYG